MEETSHNSNNNHLVMKIKSKYILAKVFEYLQQKKGLKIIQYNKNCQKKIGKRFIDYKREYSKIIIEIIRCQDKEGKFINIEKKMRDIITFISMMMKKELQNAKN